MKEHSTLSDDGTRLRFARWNEDGKKDLLIIHGLAEHLGRYLHIGQFFADRGWRVTFVELRGHGESDGKRGHVDMWLRYFEDVQSIMSAVGRPMAILAHSMGGLVTLHSMMHPLTPTVRCVSLSNPLISPYEFPPKVKIWAGKILSKIMPSFSLSNELKAEMISRDPEVVESYKNDDHVFTTYTARWGAEAIKQFGIVSDYAPQFKIPLQMNIGTADQITSPDAARSFAANYGGDCTLQIYEKLYHELMNEPEKETVMAEMDRWMSTYFNS
jgi:alpha-beta hydrolase superfamily lysophospholipase